MLPVLTFYLTIFSLPRQLKDSVVKIIVVGGHLELTVVAALIFLASPKPFLSIFLHDYDIFHIC